jgi:ankyrin repeat protein
MNTSLTRRGALLSISTVLLSARALARGARRRDEPRGAEAEALLAAVRAGDAARVRELLARDPALAAARDGRGLSAYLLAWLGGHEEIAALLAATGLELDVVECVFADDWTRVEALLCAEPALANALHPIGGTPLYAAALAGTDEMWRLRGLGCRPDEAPPGGTGFTPARGGMEHRLESGALISVTDLLSNGGNPNAPQRGGDSVLHAAVRRRSERLVRLAVRKLVAVDARDAAGRTARDLAAELEWPAGVALLDAHAALPRDHRASRFAFDARGERVVRTDLSDVSQERQNAVTSASHAKLQQLRAHLEEDPRLTFSISTDDELAIEACAHVGNRDIIRTHLDHGAPLSLPTAISLGDLAAVKRLLDWDPLLVHERGAHDFAPMHYVCIGGAGPEMAELLHGRGMPIDQESQGTTTLHWCARRDDAELAAWLVEHGCELSPVGYRWNKNGETPLEIARRDGSKEVADLLEGAGAER